MAALQSNEESKGENPLDIDPTEESKTGDAALPLIEMPLESGNNSSSSGDSNL